MHIHTLTWANEITWNVDDGQQFGVAPVFEDNTDYWEQLTLTSGEHSFNYLDAYGDGWHGGYWEIFAGSVDADSSRGMTPIAGGAVAGLVEGLGGETTIVLGAFLVAVVLRAHVRRPGAAAAAT
eukprot:COSAG03_NODE_12056_length_563_cov_1.394397_1_plen_123_part_01